MTHILVQREAFGRPGLPVPSRYLRVWLCSQPKCDWWGDRGEAHYGSDGSGKHHSDYTYESPCDVRATVYARYADMPARWPKRR